MKFISKQLQHRAMRVQAADYQTPQGHLSLTLCGVKTLLIARE